MTAQIRLLNRPRLSPFYPPYLLWSIIAIHFTNVNIQSFSNRLVSYLLYSPSIITCSFRSTPVFYVYAMETIAEIETHHLLNSRLLSVHTRFYVREMRIKAYAQLLESYRSVTMKNLCTAFGVGEDFMDAYVFFNCSQVVPIVARALIIICSNQYGCYSDLARFIAAGRLNCSIDRVNGIVETNRPDAKNARYEAVLKQGDILLTSVQRLSRVIG